MRMDVGYAALLAVGSALFGAGVSWGAMRELVKRLRLDLNGVGKKYGRLRDALLLAVPPEKKDELIRFLG
ncbi:MAG TPA: hypothetical protein VN788_00115 [Verrucomicrobiae bacterium]|nr:hypothetical protein [Verrucomicrobiae bacterium]